MVDITGKQDAIAIKEKYQKALDYTHESVRKQIGVLYDMNHKLKWGLSEIQKFKKDIIVDEEERARLYTDLNNLLNKETNFEKTMMQTSQKGKKSSSIKIKPKFKDVDEVKFNAMQDYLDKYPEYTSKSSFKKILEKIENIESGIKKTKKEYNRAVTDVLRELSYFPGNIMNAEDKIKRFKDQLKEANEKLRNMRFLKSIAYKLASEREKSKVNINTLYYRIEEKENVVKGLKEEVEKSKRQDLEKMEY